MLTNKYLNRTMALTAALCAGLGAATANAQDDSAALFPFVISHEAPDNVTNLSHLLEAPAGKHGFVRVENGRFVTDAGPIKFNATNLTGAANFPTHEEADRLAARLARFGINCVRLHYFDAPYGNFRNEREPGLYGLSDALPKAFSADPEVAIPFDAQELDRLDYLIAALKKHGIYIDMNLHVARFQKGLSFFVPAMIASEKDFAKQLLTHVNPYTGLAYVDDPAMAVIEINNENSLFSSYHKGNLDRLAKPYEAEFQRQWNAWLKNKYGNTAALRKAWDWNATPLHSEQIADGNFSQPVDMSGKTWALSVGNAQANAGVENGAMKIVVEKEGANHFPKLLRKGIQLKKGESYTLSFKVRRVGGKGNVQLGIAVSPATGAWRSLGLHTTVNVGGKWHTVQESFTANADTNNALLQLTRFKKGTYEIKDLSIKSGAVNDLDETQNLENGTIAAIKYKSAVPLEARRDFYRFLVDTERAYWTGMDSYVKNELKAKVPVAGTQLGYSMPFLQDDLDYVDTHSYWTHPSGIQDKNWRIGNHSMVNSMARVQVLAAERVLGKPYTVSEYNHPFPNQYGAEGQPMLRAMGALQGWDGVFAYTWHHRRNPEPGENSYFFSISERPDVLAHMPASAAIFLRGDVAEAKETVAAPIDYDTYFTEFTDAGRGIGVGIDRVGFKRDLAMLHKVGVELSGKEATDASLFDQAAADARVLVSDTGELNWNREAAGAGYFTVNTAATKLFTGFPNGRTITLGDVTLKIGKTRMDWATVSLVSRFAQGGFGEDGKAASILLSATGQSLNNGMKLKQISETGVGEMEWGGAPTMVEGIPAVVGLPSDAARTRCYALDGNGERIREVPVEKTATGCQIAIGPEYKTIWYEIEVK